MAVDLQGRTVPAFELRPENVFHKIACLLRGADEAEVRRFFQLDVVRHFERHQGWSVEGEGAGLVIYRADKRVRPDDLRDFIRDAEAIAEVMAR